MSNEQVKTGLDVKKTRYVLAIFAFFFGLSMAYLTYADVIDLQTFFSVMTLMLVFSIIIHYKLNGVEKEQKKQEKESGVA